MKLSTSKAWIIQEQIYLVKKQNCKAVKKPSDAILYIDKDGKIRYNYLKLAAVYKVLELY